LRVLVAVCRRLDAHGLDPGGLQAAVERHGDDVVLVDDLCGDGDAIGSLVSGVADGRVVLAVCPDGPSSDEVRARARRAGLDAGVGVLRVDSVRAAEIGDGAGAIRRVAGVLHAAAARLSALPMSSADAFRLALPAGEISRRSLLSMARTSYQPVAVVGQGACRGTVVCGLCVDACPVDAVEPAGRTPRVAKDRCIGCAACVTACPVDGAVRLPGADLVGFEAQIDALVASQPGVRLLVACRGAPPVPPERLSGDWASLEVPCLSIVTSGWVFQALQAGAQAVAFRGCGAACDARAPERVEPRVAFAREALEAIGVDHPDDRVVLLFPEDDEGTVALGRNLKVKMPREGAGGPVQLREPAATASVIAGGVGPLRSAGSPLGIVSVSTDGCTMCGLCATVCPTEAFRFDEGPVAATLDLDRDRCVACGHCVAICPEHVIDVERGADLEALGAGAASVKRSTMARCRRCGEPIASSAMLDRIRALLPDDPGVLDTVEGLCSNCRGR
jgi:ferredoxin